MKKIHQQQTNTNENTKRCSSARKKMIPASSSEMQKRVKRKIEDKHKGKYKRILRIETIIVKSYGVLNI